MKSSRYLRQTVLPEVGPEGQKKIEKARILCVGVGGLGSPAAMYLAAAGVGKLGLVDFDHVEESNLQRQILYSTRDAGRPKLEAARERLAALNPNIEIELFPGRLTAAAVMDIFRRYEIIIDGTDNFPARYLINDAAAKMGIPVVYGSISGFEGRVSVFWKKQGPCYRCVYPEPPLLPVANCAEAGVLGAVAGIIGSMQALEALKLVLMNPSLEPLIGKMVVMDGATLSFSSFKVSKNPSCRICSSSSDEIVLESSLPTQCNVSFAAGELLIDVREEDEWKSGRIPGALHWALSRMEKREFPKEIDKETRRCTVYCRSGLRSVRAVALLKGQGFQNVHSLEGGILAWPGPLET